MEPKQKVFPKGRVCRERVLMEFCEAVPSNEVKMALLPVQAGRDGSGSVF
jgi:hypothetical protein